MQVVPSELPTYHHSNFVVSFSLRLLNTNTKKKERNLASSHHFYPPKIWIPWGFGCLSTEPAACVIFPRSSSSTPRCIRALWKISIGTQPWKSWFLEEKKQTPPKVTPKISYIYFLMNSFYIFLHFWHMRDHEPYQSPRRPFAGFQPVRGGSLLPTMLPTYRVATFTNIDSPKSGERFRKCGGANGLRFLGTKFSYLGFPYKTHPKPATVHLFPPCFWFW